MVSVFGPGYLARWRESPWLMGMLHLLSPLMLPLGLAMATPHWLSCRTARELPCPPHLLDQIGPLLTVEQALAAIEVQLARQAAAAASPQRPVKR